MTACTLTPIWQFPTLPSDPEYIRATPGESVPSFGNPVSSIDQRPRVDELLPPTAPARPRTCA